MEWIVKKFNELTLEEFHDILQLRIDVFVVEQNCPYPELDSKDKKAFHLFCKNSKGKIIGYTRFFKAGDYYTEAALGRVVVHAAYRNKKLGVQLLRKTLLEMEKLIGKGVIKIGAQTHLKKFYGSFGFQQIGEGYIEDGIPHIHMLLKIKINE